jgi:hypothetical protein
MFKKKENKQPKNVGKDTGTLLAGMWISTATMEISMEAP